MTRLCVVIHLAQVIFQKMNHKSSSSGKHRHILKHNIKRNLRGHDCVLSFIWLRLYFRVRTSRGENTHEDMIWCVNPCNCESDTKYLDELTAIFLGSSAELVHRRTPKDNDLSVKIREDVKYQRNVLTDCTRNITFLERSTDDQLLSNDFST